MSTLILATLLVIFIIGWLWPSSSRQLELLWTVAPREAERMRIWRLILPNEALDFGSPAAKPSPVQGAPGERPATLVKRVSESVGVARLLSPDARRQSSSWEHNWT